MNRRLLIIVLLLLSIFFTACLSTSSEPDIVTGNTVAPLPPTWTSEPAVQPASFDLESGASLYEENCKPCHGETGQGDGPVATGIECPLPDFTQRLDDVTLLDWFNLVSNGTRFPPDPSCPMPAWTNELPLAEDRWNVTAYAYGFADGGETIVAAVDVQGTEEPGASNPTSESPTEAASPEVDETAAPTDEPIADSTTVPTEEAAVAATEEPSDEETLDVFTLTGVITNGTEGATVPENLQLQLYIIALDENDLPVHYYTAEGATDTEGNFVFTDVPIYQGGLFLQTEYAGINQYSSVVLLPVDVEGDSHEVPFIIYETTDDPADIQIFASEAYIGAVTAESVAEIHQIIEYLNTGDKVFIGEDGYTVDLWLPIGANLLDAFAFSIPSWLEQISIGNTTQRFEQFPSEDVLGYRDNFPLFPGIDNNLQVQVFYQLTYDGSVVITQAFPYPVENSLLFSNHTLFLEITGNDIVPTDGTTRNETPYDGYIYTGTLEAGDSMTYRVADTADTPDMSSPPVPSTTTTGADDADDGNSILQDNSSLILSIGILMIIAGGMYLLYDLQKTRILTEAQSKTHATSQRSKDELIAEIAALDDAFEKGEIDGEDYEDRRDALKEDLRRHF